MSQGRVFPVPMGRNGDPGPVSSKPRSHVSFRVLGAWSRGRSRPVLVTTQHGEKQPDFRDRTPAFLYLGFVLFLGGGAFWNSWGIPVLPILGPRLPRGLPRDSAPHSPS